MDEAQALVTLFGNGFFPMIMCVILCVFIKYIMNKFESMLTELKTSIDKLNTRVDTMFDFIQNKEDKDGNSKD